jgi:septal ring factor EnvC (AmiA/AmiB activator)
MTSFLPLVGALGGIAAIITAVVLVLKVGVEKTDVKITTADKVMIGQDRFIEQLEEAVKLTQGQVDTLRTEVASLRSGLYTITEERDRLRAENLDLRHRVSQLEQRVEDLSNGNHESRGERRAREDLE